MILQKDRKKFQKKSIKGLFRNRNNKCTKVMFGSFGLRSLENGYITSKILESTRRILSKKLKKIAKIWIRIKPNIFITSKTGDRRMGKGKGTPLLKIFKVSCGMVLFEVEGLNSQIICELLKKAKKKLPLKMRLLKI